MFQRISPVSLLSSKYYGIILYPISLLSSKYYGLILYPIASLPSKYHGFILYPIAFYIKCTDCYGIQVLKYIFWFSKKGEKTSILKKIKNHNNEHFVRIHK